MRRRGSTKARQRVVGGKTRRDLRALSLRPRAGIPASDGQGPRPRAGGASSRRARPRHVASVPGSGQRVGAERVCAFQRVRGPARSCAFRARVGECSRGCESELTARRGGKGIPNASGAERSTHRARPGAHSELRRHGRSRREPRRARSAGDTPALHHGAPPPQNLGGSSPIKKKEPTTFSKEKQNPSGSQSGSPPPPKPLLRS